MKQFTRTFLLALVWFSLLVVPYAITFYVCYSGLCGGPGVSPHYVSIVGYYIWLYPLIVFASLFYARRLNKASRLSQSIMALLIPFICLLPLLYVIYNTGSQFANYNKLQANMYNIQPDDFVCAPEQFVRHPKSNPYLDDIFYFFEGKRSDYGVAWSIYSYSTREALAAALKDKGIDLAQCKNPKGQGI